MDYSYTTDQTATNHPITVAGATVNGAGYSTVSTTDDAGNVTSILADLSGRQVRTIDPDAGTIEVDVRPRRGSKPHCSCCGKAAAGYDVLPTRRFEPYTVRSGYNIWRSAAR